MIKREKLYEMGLLKRSKLITEAMIGDEIRTKWGGGKIVDVGNKKVFVKLDSGRDVVIDKNYTHIESRKLTEAKTDDVIYNRMVGKYEIVLQKNKLDELYVYIVSPGSKGKVLTISFVKDEEKGKKLVDIVAQQFQDYNVLSSKYFPDIKINSLKIAKSKGIIDEVNMESRKLTEAKTDTKDIKAKNPGILDLPENGFVDKTIEQLVKHVVKIAKDKGRSPVSKALQNLVRWNKNDNPSLSKKAQSVFDKYSKEMDDIEAKAKEKK